MGFLGSKSKSSSSNKAYDYLQSAYAPQVSAGTQATNALSGLLGLGGDQAAAQQGYQNFLSSTGFNNVLNTSLQGLTGNAALSGQLQSGSTMRAAQDRAVNLGQQQFSNYLSQLGNMSSLGLNAGSLIGSAGQTSTGKGGSGLMGLF